MFRAGGFFPSAENGAGLSLLPDRRRHLPVRRTAEKKSGFFKSAWLFSSARTSPIGLIEMKDRATGERAW